MKVLGREDMKYGCSSLGVVLFVGLLVFGSAGSEPEGRLFPEVPVVDLVVMTPMWPTNSGGPRFMTLGNHVAGGKVEVEKAVVVDGAHRVSDAGVRGTLIVPEFALGRNFPNPFNSSTAVVYTLPEATHVKLVVYDLLGRVVKVLVNGVQDAGRHRAVWDGRDGSGRPVASGLYLIRMEAGTFRKVRGAVLVR